MIRDLRKVTRPLKWAILLAFLVFPAEALARGGVFKLHIVDADTQQPLAGRLHLKNSKGRAIRSSKIGIVWDDHITIDGTATLKLGKGHYQFELECGPEYKTRAGHFEIKDLADDEKRVEMTRYVDLSREGWWSGDLNVRRPASEMERLMRAEDLHLVPLLTRGSLESSNKSRSGKSTGLGLNELQVFGKNRLCRPGAALLDDSGGRLLAFHLGEKQVAGWSPAALLKRTPVEQSEEGLPAVHLDAPRAASWDLPLWVAAGAVDSIGLIGSQQRRLAVDRSLASDRPFDRTMYPGPHGAGRWAETIYYHLLECGLRIPPSASSGSGVVGSGKGRTTTGKNPPGYNRTYVFCGDEFSYDQWWKNLREGKVFVTNGPLLRARAGGELPGHVFVADEGERLDLFVELSLSTRDKIEYLEIVRDGKIEHEVRLDKWAAAGGKLPPLRFEQSGWFLVRAVTTKEKTYRLASTGPFYVQIGYEPRISRQSVQFFLDWLDELEKRNAANEKSQNEFRQKSFSDALTYWRERLKKANAE